MKVIISDETSDISRYNDIIFDNNYNNTFCYRHYTEMQKHR